MNLQKEQTGMIEKEIDAHIEDLIKDADSLDVGTVLRADLIKNNEKAAERWDTVYRKEKSCLKEDNYYQKMREKYIKVYKICLGLIKE